MKAQDTISAAVFSVNDFNGNETEYAAFSEAMERRHENAEALAQAQAEAALLAAKSAAWYGKTGALTAFLNKTQALAFWQAKAELFAAFLCGYVVTTQQRNGRYIYNVARTNRGGLQYDKETREYSLADGGSDAARQRYAHAVKRCKIKGAHKGAALLALLPALRWQPAQKNSGISSLAEAIEKARKFQFSNAHDAEAWIKILDKLNK